MSKIENGKVNPSFLTLTKIAKTIGVPITKLVDFATIESNKNAK